MTLALLAFLFAEPDWTSIERHAVDLLQRYVRIQSVNPPADAREAAALFEAELKQGGLEPRRFVSQPETGKVNLVVRLPGRDRSKKPLLLLNHFDVVPVDRAAWGSIDPFGGEIKDGAIWGRGTLDMKGIGIMHLVALTTLKRAGITPSRDIVMLTTPDEETNGTYGVVWMAQNHFPEIDAEYVLDEGGMGTRDVFSPGKLVFGVAVGEKQVAWIRVRAKGTAGHGSQPIPDNANERLISALARALDAPARGRVHPVVDEMRRSLGGALASNKYVNAIQKNTLSLTTLRAGVGEPLKANVIPSAAEATIDCRLLPGVNAEEFVSEMRARINDPNVTVELISTPNDPGASNHKTPLFEAISRAILRYHPSATVTPIIVPHGTDSVKLRMRGLTAYGLTPMVLDLATAGTMHSDQERIPVEEFKKGLRIMFDVLRSEF
ncbi:MAG: M20/M25/M40 family metallo-hydrolase [Acidobacteria bacterium]|nr:M20/M25/M40 family metallo-hydrolase [Acidobacteriota bacterium]